MRAWSRIAIIGTALYASWPFAAFYSETLLSFGALEPWARNAIWVCSLSFLLLGFLVMSVLGKRADRAFLDRRYQIMCASAFAVGNGLILIAGLFGEAQHELAVAIGCCGASLAGLSSSFFEIGWRYILYGIDEEGIEINIAVASVLSRIVIIMFMVLGFPVGSLLLFVVVIGSPALLVLCGQVLRARRRVSEGRSKEIACSQQRSLMRTKSVLWCGCIVAVFWFGYCTLENMTVPQRMTDSPVLLFSMVCGCAISFVLAAGFTFYRKSVSLATVVKDAALTLGLVLLFAAFLPSEDSYIVYTLGSSVQLALSIMLWISGISFVQMYGESFARVQSLIRLFLYIGVLGASLAWRTLEKMQTIPVLFVLTFVLLAVTLVVLGKIVDENQKDAVERECGDRTESFAVEGALGSDERSRKIQVVAGSYNLSPREKEVFELLINGRDSVFIRNKLYISKNTVGSHIKNIYKKTGVHSRQELIDVFERNL